ncbi:hypothetical protein NliqN6_5778 [Naganishia liquefaciens]|uniref:Mediator of RNA polymerase II transcription subunit 21 n=1 Tax=Naganishia liquefaciens TaxID=104408 RepID=A0A8H3TYT1_9TREE|nr:hypothetical protein NliqN6_5778 [Naganishia liquefaciens]
MDALCEEASNEMDRVTQLQDGILSLIKQTHKALEDLTKLTPLLPHDPTVYPPAETKRDREKVNTLSSEEFEQHKIQLVGEFVQRAKQVQVLIDVMPSPEDAQTITNRIDAMQSDLTAANAKYRAALAQTQALQEEYKRTLGVLLDQSVMQVTSGTTAK